MVRKSKHKILKTNRQRAPRRAGRFNATKSQCTHSSARTRRWGGREGRRNRDEKSPSHGGDSAQFAQFCLLACLLARPPARPTDRPSSRSPARLVAHLLGVGSQLQGSRKCSCPKVRTPVPRPIGVGGSSPISPAEPPPALRCEMCTCWQIDQRHHGDGGSGGSVSHSGGVHLWGLT